MARTKKQVLQATARKQQLHLEAEQRAAQLAESAGTPQTKSKTGKIDAASSHPILAYRKHNEALERPPGRPNSSLTKKGRSSMDNVKETKDANCSFEGRLLKKALSQKFCKDVELSQETEVVAAVEMKIKKRQSLEASELDVPENKVLTAEPVCGPINIRRTKMTARKSTNSLKSSEARELLESLAETDFPRKPSVNSSTDVHLIESGTVVPHQSARKSMPLQAGHAKLTARKSHPRFKLCARKSLLSTETDQGLNTSKGLESNLVSTTFSDTEAVSVFPSVHEAVITLPRSEKLPVALVCIKDIYKAAEPQMLHTTSVKADVKTPSTPRGRKSRNELVSERSEEKRRSPRRSPKGERASKNIFERFQTEIKEKQNSASNDGLCTPSRKSASQKVESNKFVSAMKVLRSVSEKVEGRNKRSGKVKGMSPRKCSPRRNSLKRSPDKSNSCGSSPNTRNSLTPVQSPSYKSKDDTLKTSDCTSPHRTRKMHSPGVKDQNNKTTPVKDTSDLEITPRSQNLIPIVKQRQISPKTKIQGANDVAPVEKEQKCIERQGAIRELHFLDICKEQIVKNIKSPPTEIEDSTLSKPDSSLWMESELKESSVPSDDVQGSSEFVCPPSLSLLDLISKVDNRIKNSIFTSLEPAEVPDDDDNSENSSLNTSHCSDTFPELHDQPDADCSDTKTKDSGSKGDPDDNVPPDVKCAELYLRLTGQVSNVPSPSKSFERIRYEQSEPSASDVKQEPSEDGKMSEKSESCLLKKHLLGDISPLRMIKEECGKLEASKVECVLDEENILSESAAVADCSLSIDSKEADGKRIPRWKKNYKTKDPLPLDVLSKPEKGPVSDKKSAFFSDVLEDYLESSKDLNLKSQKTPVIMKDGCSPLDNNLDSKELEPDFDEVEGVLFLSFATKDVMDAHIAVEKKNKWDKDANHLLGVSRLLACEREKTEGDSPELDKSKTSQNLRGQHMKWKKYKRMLKEELDNLKLAREHGEPFSSFRHLEKTSDITKIKGWRNKFSDLGDADAGKLHWRTEERLLRNLQPDDIKALGIKKKRRKNVVFTHRKGTSKDVGYPTTRTSIYSQSGNLEEHADNWDVVMGEYEEPLFDNSGYWDQNSEDEEVRRVNERFESRKGHDLARLLHDTSDIKDRPFGYAKQTQIKQEFASMFNWDEEEMNIIKKLGGRVRNRRKKNDPTDMTSLLAESESPEMTFKMRIRQRRSVYVPVAVITEKMAIDATCALDFGKYKPAKSGSGYSDNILTKHLTKKTSPVKILPKRKSLVGSAVDRNEMGMRLPVHKRRRTQSIDSGGSPVDLCDTYLKHSSENNERRSCDKPGCRYGCICHLCNDNQVDMEPRSYQSFQHVCNKEYCRLGCICESLSASQETANTSHCGKPECMLQCICLNQDQKSSADHFGHCDDANSSDEIPPLIQDSDLHECSKPDHEKSKEKEKSTAKTWSRHPKGDKYSNLPRRESRHRVSKNLDAITRKAMIVYETSEVYCEQSGRARKKNAEEVSPTLKSGPSKLVSPNSRHGKNIVPAKAVKRKSSVSQEVVQISDEEETQEKCARLTAYHSRGPERPVGNDPTMVRIEQADTNSSGSSVNITPGNSRPNTPAVNPQDLKNPLEKIAAERNRAALAAEQMSRHQNRILTPEMLSSTWHTQMVCLKANPKPKDPKDPSTDQPDVDEEEIKLLEFLSNCDWDDAKPLILSRVAQCLSRGVYPDPRRMCIGEFIVEILPKSDQVAVIPPELQDKLPKSMFSIRVKVMRKATEQDIRRFQMKAAAAAARIKAQKAMNRPQDSVSGQSCDSASRRVFRNAKLNSMGMNQIMSSIGKTKVSESTTASAASNSKSSPMGISGLSRLQISHTSSAFLGTSKKDEAMSDEKGSDVTSLHDISSVKPAPDSQIETEHITVENTETGDSIAMVVEHSENVIISDEREPVNNLKSKTDPKIPTVQRNDSSDISLNVLKPKTIGQMVKSVLPKSCEGTSSDGQSDRTPSGDVGRDEQEKVMTIDLTDEIEPCTNSKTNESNALLRSQLTKGNNGESSKVPELPTTSLTSSGESHNQGKPLTSTVKPVASNSAVKQTLSAVIPPACTAKVLIPVAGPVTAPGTPPTLLLAAPPIPGNTASSSTQAKPTKTIISAPGGKLYGPFSNIDQVKMFHVRTPDGVTQPLLNLLPPNSLSFGSSVDSKHKPSSLSAKTLHVSNLTTSELNADGAVSKLDGDSEHVKSKTKAGNGPRRQKPATQKSKSSRCVSGSDGTVLNLDEEGKKLKTNNQNKPKKVKRKKSKSDPPASSVNGIAVESPQKSKRRKTNAAKSKASDEIDGSSASVSQLPEISKSFINSGSVSQGQILAEGRFPYFGKDQLKLKLPSGETILVTPTGSGVPTSFPPKMTNGNKSSLAADKENIDGETPMDPLNKLLSDNDSQKRDSIQGATRQGRSSSLDTLPTASFRTSTPTTGAMRAHSSVMSCDPVRRQRSDSDPSTLAGSVNRMKKINVTDARGASPLFGDAISKLTPIQKDLMNTTVINLSDEDDDSQTSFSSTGNSSQKHGSEEAYAGTEEKLKVKKTFRERERRHDMLCMFMYLYNILSKTEGTTNASFSRQQVLDAAEEAISYEEQLSEQLQEELNMEKFYRRAQKRRLRTAVDELLGKGVPARTLLVHLEDVKQKEEKRHKKRQLLRKIIEYGKQKQEASVGKTAKDVDNRLKIQHSGSRKLYSLDRATGKTMLDKIRNSKELKTDAETPGCYWSEDFLIEIDKEESDSEETQGQVTPSEVNEDSQDFEFVIKDEQLEAERECDHEEVGSAEMNVGAGKEHDRDMSECLNKTKGEITLSKVDREVTPIQDMSSQNGAESIADSQHEKSVDVALEKRKDVTGECKDQFDSNETSLDGDNSEVASYANTESCNSTSMQNSPALGGDSSVLREDSVESEKDACAPLQRSNSEEAILQVESFIENAKLQECYSRCVEPGERKSAFDQNEINNLEKDTNGAGFEQRKELGSVTSPVWGDCSEVEEVVLEDKETIFDSLLPFEVNFDDASADSVPLESMSPSCGSLNEDKENSADMMQASKYAEKNPQKELLPSGDGLSTNKTCSEDNENFMICDVRGLASEEYFCPS